MMNAEELGFERGEWVGVGTGGIIEGYAKLLIYLDTSKPIVYLRIINPYESKLYHDNNHLSRVHATLFRKLPYHVQEQYEQLHGDDLTKWNASLRPE